MKKGTLLECIDPHNDLEKGKIYKYVSTNSFKNYMVESENDRFPIGGFFPSRFKIAKTSKTINSMKIGDKIKCISAKDSNSLFTGSLYEVWAFNDYGNIQVKDAVDDVILTHFYKPERFVVVKEKVKKKIEEFKIDFSKKYQTRSGQKVNLIGPSKDKDYPIVGEYLYSSDNWAISCWTSDGRWSVDEEESSLDLVEVIDEITVNCGSFSVKIYKDKSVYIHGPELDETISAQEMKKIVEAWNSFS